MTKIMMMTKIKKLNKNGRKKENNVEKMVYYIWISTTEMDRNNF